MTNLNNHSVEFSALQDPYDTAERFIKEVELCRESVPFPAINQLRCAGHHLLKGLVSDESQGLSDELGDVKDHCHRAMYEAADAGIIYLFRLLQRFQDYFKDVSIRSVIPEYVEILVTAREAKALLFQGRLNRESPKEQVGKYMEKFRELRNGTDKLEAGRDELNKLKADRRRSDQRFTVQVVFWVCMVVLAALSLLLVQL